MTRALLLFLSLAVTAAAQATQWGPEAYGLLKGTFAYDEGFPLNARIAGTGQHDGISYERLVFTSFHNGSVPGYLAIPADADGPVPVVMLLHGLNGNKRQWLHDEFTNGGLITQGLLQRGYAVLTLDAQYHGERAVYNDYINPAEMVFQRNWGMRYVNMMTQTIVDYRRALDYLATRPEIDASRVGILGYSMGGHMSFILGAVEDRISAIVACVTPATPGMPIAASAFAHDLGGDRLLMLMAREDQFYSVEQAQALFDDAGAENKRLEFYDSGHSLPADYTADAVQWLSENL